MSLLEEIQVRHRNFHRFIAKKADAIKPKKLVEALPNYDHCMWFYDLVQEIKPRKVRPLSIRSIQIATADYFGVSLTDMLSARRTACVVNPRQVAMYLAGTLTLQTLHEIGRRFNRDHTTILYAIRKIERLAKINTELAADIAEIKSWFPRGTT